mmetsp:Transcript_19907/g.61600  ORF Transcript_19907/g.61600 Transcript_19907/m.61600 type:complete len:529 (-) Transcript_19907:840-2426(-)
MLKRSNEYSQIRREEYEQRFQEDDASQRAAPSFPVADAATLASRRLVKAQRAPPPLKTKKKVAKKEAEAVDYFRRRVAALNASFAEWALSLSSSSKKGDDDEALATGARDYAFFARELERLLEPKEDTSVSSFGSGDCGQLGHGTSSDRDAIVPRPRVIAAFRDVRISQIACGGLHNVACTYEGAVYTWGCNDDGSLGREDPEEEAVVPKRLPQLSEIASVAAGDTQSFAVRRSGDVYGWGCYKDKEGKQWFDCNLSLEPKRKQTTPLLIESLRKVRDLACGAAFNVALRSDGLVLTWGIGQVGELGRDVRPMTTTDDKSYDLEAIRRDYLSPRAISSSEKFKCVGAGAYHFLAATASQVRAAGLNNYGQLGDGTTNDTSTDTVVVKNLSAVVSLDGGTHHSLCLATDGGVYAWGRSDYGQLGLGADVATQAGGSVKLPTRLAFPADKGQVTAVAAGSNHNLAVVNDDRVYAWGYGDTNALGVGSVTSSEDKVLPTEIDLSEGRLVAQVRAGGQHSAILLYPPSSSSS